MGHVRQMGHVDASADQAFALSIDAKRIPEWNSSVSETKDVSGPLDKVGASYVAILKLGGSRLESRWEVSKVEKPRLLEFTGSAPGGGRATAITRIEPTPGGRGSDDRSRIRAPWWVRRRDGRQALRRTSDRARRQALSREFQGDLRSRGRRSCLRAIGSWVGVGDEQLAVDAPEQDIRVPAGSLARESMKPGGFAGLRCADFGT